MPFDDLLRNAPLLRRALAAGEERVGKALGTLLAGEGLAGGLRALAAGAEQARETLERGVAQALHAANLPSREDVAGLRRRLDELEALLDGLAEKAEAPARGGGEGGRGGGGEGGRGGGGGAP